MFEGYKPTKSERDAIEKGWRVILRCAHHTFTAESRAKQEARGYGFRSDRVPLIAAKALICQWFMNGTYNPGALLRKYYDLRPVAIWATGLGADCSGKLDADELSAIGSANRAHKEAFNRMVEANRTFFMEAAAKED